MGITKTNRLNIPVAQIKGFVVTGVIYRKKSRFSIPVSTFEQAMMYNLYRGSVWAILDNGKRKLLKRVYN